MDVYLNKYTNKEKITRAWPILLELIKETLNYYPSSFLVLFRLLDTFVKRADPLHDKRSKRDLQVIISNYAKYVYLNILNGK